MLKHKAKQHVIQATNAPIISIVACRMNDFGIGIGGKLPWKLSKEMTYFRQTTSSTFDPTKRNAVVMGRKTWDSIPNKFRPLSKRLNVVVSRGFSSEWDLHGDVVSSNSLHGSLQTLKKNSELYNIERIYIIGGAEIYNQTLELTEYMLMTKVYPMSDELSSIKMNTFLDKQIVLKNFEEDSSEIRNFLPPFVELPDDCKMLKEGDYCYKFTLYKRLS